ncbi:MAG: thioredoxin family protein [Paracoccaceae bacterium]|uniref:thioredoxin family protein n=1 Tax=Seohaeicola saemankumensis TaxID=481181 RepID=UPI001E2EC4A4|nr:thioredoxin family protein [Seohaeicola saemankumensis]MCD1624859.1 thioredoxin family protein [Seohaeicola saemankumensis]
MNRRDFIALTSTTIVTLAMPLAVRATGLPYTPDLLAARLAADETVFLDFKASWCSTCAAQERVLKALKAESPAYEEKITFIDVDWDEYGRSQIVQDLKIPRRSTLVVLRGDRELGRIVAQTGRAEIKALMDTALEAASA